MDHSDAPTGDLDPEPVMLPRDAFFGPKETVEAGQAAGRIAAEQITPYPPGWNYPAPPTPACKRCGSSPRSELAGVTRQAAAVRPVS